MIRNFGLILATGIAVSTSAGAAEISEKEFFSLAEKLCRPKVEPWRTIPWKTSLLEAQNLAVKERKPIFIWAMDGHPLGCT